MQKLWLITAAMVALGIAMVSVSLLASAGPIFLVAGVLLIWSALVKAIVLRVWRATLASPPLPEPRRTGARAGALFGRPS